METLNVTIQPSEVVRRSQSEGWHAELLTEGNDEDLPPVVHKFGLHVGAGEVLISGQHFAAFEEMRVYGANIGIWR